MPSTWAHVQRTLIADEPGHHFTVRGLPAPAALARRGARHLPRVAGAGRPIAGADPGRRPQPRGRPAPARLEVLPRPTAPWLDAAGYARAWALVHFLVNVDSARFDAYTGRLAGGADPAAAWREVFPEWDPSSQEGGAALDRALRDYLGGGHFLLGAAARPQPPVTLEERALSPAEVLELRLTPLPRFNSGQGLPGQGGAGRDRRGAGRGPGARGRPLGPGGPRAARTAESGDPGSAAHPEDGRSWLLVAEGLPKADVPARERGAPPRRGRRAAEPAGGPLARRPAPPGRGGPARRCPSPAGPPRRCRAASGPRRCSPRCSATWAAASRRWRPRSGPWRRRSCPGEGAAGGAGAARGDVPRLRRDLVRPARAPRRPVHPGEPRPVWMRPWARRCARIAGRQAVSSGGRHLGQAPLQRLGLARRLHGRTGPEREGPAREGRHAGPRVGLRAGRRPADVRRVGGA